MTIRTIGFMAAMLAISVVSSQASSNVAETTAPALFAAAGGSIILDAGPAKAQPTELARRGRGADDPPGDDRGGKSRGGKGGKGRGGHDDGPNHT